MLFAMTLNLQIPSGKNQIRQGFKKPTLFLPKGRVFRYPNKRFEVWRKAAAVEILEQQHGIWGMLPITVPIHLKVFYLPQDKLRRDLAGMLDALGHLFEYCKVLENDAQIVELSWIRRTAPLEIDLKGKNLVGLFSGEPCLILEFHQFTDHPPTRWGHDA